MKIRSIIDPSRGHTLEQGDMVANQSVDHQENAEMYCAPPHHGYGEFYDSQYYMHNPTCIHREFGEIFFRKLGGGILYEFYKLSVQQKGTWTWILWHKLAETGSMKDVKDIFFVS